VELGFISEGGVSGCGGVCEWVGSVLKIGVGVDEAVVELEI
jgi:hypothetical protein